MVNHICLFRFATSNLKSLAAQKQTPPVLCEREQIIIQRFLTDDCKYEFPLFLD